jgi:hypothetical protein
MVVGQNNENNLPIGRRLLEVRTNTMTLGRRLFQFIMSSGSFTMSVGEDGQISTSGSFTMSVPHEKTSEPDLRLAEETPKALAKPPPKPKPKPKPKPGAGQCVHHVDSGAGKCYEGCTSYNGDFKVKGLEAAGTCPSSYNVVDSDHTVQECSDGYTNVKYCSGGSLKVIDVEEKTKGTSFTVPAALDRQHAALYLCLALLVAGFSVVLCKRRRSHDLILLETQYKKASSSSHDQV